MLSGLGDTFRAMLEDSEARAEGTLPAASHHVVGMNGARKPRPRAGRPSRGPGQPQLILGQEQRQAPQSAHKHPHPILCGFCSNTDAAAASTASPPVFFLR